MEGRLHRPSPAMVVALIALFVALGGTATALTGSNSVFSDDIAPRNVKQSDINAGAVASGKLAANAVTNGKLAAGAVTGDKLAPASVTTGKVLDNNLTAADIADTSSLGAAEINEPDLNTVPAATNAANANFASTIGNGAVHPGGFATITHRTAFVDVPGGGTAENGNYDTDSVFKQCNTGEMALTGGAYWTETNGDFVPADSELWVSQLFWNWDGATGRPTALHVMGGNDTGTTRRLTVEVFCLG